MAQFSGIMYGHRLADYDGTGPGLTGAYDDEEMRRSDLALFHDRDMAEAEAAKINACERMAPVVVVAVTVGLTLDAGDGQ